MALTAAGAALLGTGLTLAGTTAGGAMNRKMTRRTNQQAVANQWAMYDRQYYDSHVAQDKMNAYNSPEMQMQRLKEAGLNPNLVYGTGAVANQGSAADTPNGNSGPQLKAPEFNENLMGELLQAFVQLSQTSAQTDNLQAQKALAEENTRLRKIQGDSEQFSLDQNKHFADVRFEGATLRNNLLRLQAHKVNADTIYTLDANRRQELANTANVQLTVQKILSEKLEVAQRQFYVANQPLERQKLESQIKQLNQMIDNASTEGAIKKLELQLNEKGIQKTDAIYWRFLSQALSGTTMSGQPDFKPSDKGVSGAPTR